MFNISEEQIVRFATKCLMVAGGYVAGYILTMLAGIGFDRLMIRRNSPEELHKVARIMGGMIGAILVALLVFGGFGSGGGQGMGTGPGDQPNSTSGSNSPETTVSQKADPKQTSANVNLEAIRVKVLAGDEVERGTEKFYVLADQAERVDRGAVSSAISDRKMAAKGPVVMVYEFGKQAGPNTTAFADLATLAKQMSIQLMSDAEYQQFVKK
jgi:hypothetical protein